MTTDVCLRFPDQATCDSVLPAGSFVNVDYIGFVMSADGVTINTTYYLANVRLLDSESLSSPQQAYVITPPLVAKRIWAPDVTGATLWQA